MDERILQHENREDEKVLRGATKPFSFSDTKEPVCNGVVFSRADFSQLILTMRKTMKKANGIGLSANQIGLPYRLFVAQVPAPGQDKFYTILNPELEKDGTETSNQEEGCLSVVGVYGNVKRPERVILRGLDRNGRMVKIKAWGLLARVFQHEVDHLNGKLFIDSATDLHNLEHTH